MFVYRPNGAPDPSVDLKILDWWLNLAQSGELESGFGVGLECLSRFMEAMQPPTALLYELDAKGAFWFCVWLQPTTMNGAYFNIWIAPERRYAHDELIAAGHEAIEYGLTKTDVLLGITKRPELLASFNRNGFVTVGAIPKIFDGHDATVTYCTEETFAPVREARKKTTLRSVKSTEAHG